MVFFGLQILIYFKGCHTGAHHLCVCFLQVDEKAKKGGFFKGLMQELFVKKVWNGQGRGVSLKYSKFVCPTTVLVQFFYQLWFRSSPLVVWDGGVPEGIIKWSNVPIISKFYPNTR